MVNEQGLPVQLICHTKPYNDRNFQIDGTSFWCMSLTPNIGPL